MDPREQKIFQCASEVFLSPRIWKALTDNPDVTKEDLKKLEKLMEICLPNKNIKDLQNGIWLNGMFVHDPDDLDQKIVCYSDGSQPIYEVVSHNPDMIGY